jgi:RNA polymerase II subunit A C-terminal domain phosphatase SSU72
MDRSGAENRPVFVVNFEIKDNHQDAAMGARAMLQLVETLVAPSVTDLESQFEDIIEKFQEKTSINTLHTVCFY